jgi:hypothetical protein
MRDFCRKSTQTYPNSPGFKEPTTSRDAAKGVRAGTREGRRAVLEAIRQAGSGGLTADEAAASVGRPVLYVGPRVTELHKLGLIIPTGARRENGSGLMAKAWRVP